MLTTNRLPRCLMGHCDDHVWSCAELWRAHRYKVSLGSLRGWLLSEVMSCAEFSRLASFQVQSTLLDNGKSTWTDHLFQRWHAFLIFVLIFQVPSSQDSNTNGYISPPILCKANNSAMFYCSSAMSGAFSGLLAFAIAKMDGIAGYEGWRWSSFTLNP